MKDSSGKYVSYGPFAFGADGKPTSETVSSLATMLMGTPSFSTVPGENPLLTKVDYSAWDLSQTCGSCHPGGGFVEKDRTGKRFSMMSPFVDGITPYTMTIFERYDAMTGLPAHTVEPAPWSYPIWNGTTPVTAPGGWGQPMEMTMPDGSKMPVVAGQVMMPNVKEMDCLMCHFEGYSNLMSSVMTYSGAHNATPSFGAGFMNMFTQAYDFATGLIQKDKDTGVVSLSSLGLSKLKYDPPSQNCRNCHTPSNLKDLPDMMRDFLSSAPMIYTGQFTQSFTGLAMPAFDFNAPMTMDGQTAFTWDWKGPYAASPTLYMTQAGIGINQPSNPMIPAGWPAAMGMTEFNKATAMATPGFLGGANPAGSGPIYYQATLADGMHQDQNVLKKSTVPFPRAEWFKRGDLWAEGYDVHITLNCSGCHMNTNTTKVDTVDAQGKVNFDGKSACDPGRGYDSAGGVEANPAKVATVNSQNTVKTCDGCHVTGKNRDGLSIETFGAPNPTIAHQNAGLLANVTKAVGLNPANGAEQDVTGNHLDVMDCTVCHLAREQMVVRLLDCTSGNRYPNMLGFKKERGMMGMFSDPMGQGAPVGNNLEKWFPLYTWQKYGNDFKTTSAGVNPNWRRKIYAVNLITAAIWNNVDGSVDANGDGVPGRQPSVHGSIEVTPSTNYDPWLSRDMKAGMNYGPSGFAPIPVGFGSGSFQSAYAPNGTFTGAFKYVGVYGGNAMFSTPEEITAYKDWRNSIKDSVDGKSWSGTQLGLVAGPYKLTHGIRPTAKFVLGKKTEAGFGCADCHAPAASAKAPIFDGSINMVGTAIRATAGGNFMQSPAEMMEIVGNSEDIETAAEVATKAGGAVEVKFEELGAWENGTFTAGAATTHKRVTELDRAEALYPSASGVNFIDVKGVDHGSRDNFKAYLTSINATDSGIGIDPTASITTVIADVDPVAPGTQVFTTDSLALNAADAQGGKGFSTYTWSAVGGTVAQDATDPKKATVTFTGAGSKSVTLVVKDEEGKSTSTTKSFEAVVPQPSVISWNDATGNLGGTLTLTGLPANTQVKVMWGDAKYNIYLTSGATTISKTHTYLAAGTKLIQVYVYNGSAQVGYFYKNITVNGSN
ncbi:cytochrome C [Geomonas paludis]|uniref:Cytochrome C n=1 Tax=Geomonas paludis TaxID=2740185 RepID=A0A6V8MYM2_9BACT|nr:cytochrome C [Geomonas paludis]UPU37145.1 cytochrome C [Geomonas paludis]GFO64757.1 cytochrome c [Geomonas paludis]